MIIRTETAYCDICDSETEERSTVTLGWVNGEKHNYDLCRDCHYKYFPKGHASYSGEKEKTMFKKMLTAFKRR